MVIQLELAKEEHQYMGELLAKTCNKELTILREQYMISGYIKLRTDRALTKSGVDYFRPTFEDELTRELKHTGAGILSMANR